MLTSMQTEEVKTMYHHVVMGVVVVMTTSLLRDVTGRCPGRCFCQQSSRTVYCSRRGLDAVPWTVPPDTRQLHLNGNHFRSPIIRRDNFSRFPDVLQVGVCVQVVTISMRSLSLKHSGLVCSIDSAVTF